MNGIRLSYMWISYLLQQCRTPCDQFYPLFKFMFLATDYVSSPWISSLCKIASLWDFIFLRWQTSSMRPRKKFPSYFLSFLSFLSFLNNFFMQPNCCYHDTNSSKFHSPFLGLLFHLTWAISLLLHQWYSWRYMVLTNVFSTFLDAWKNCYHT